MLTFLIQHKQTFLKCFSSTLVLYHLFSQIRVRVVPFSCSLIVSCIIIDIVCVILSVDYINYNLMSTKIYFCITASVKPSAKLPFVQYNVKNFMAMYCVRDGKKRSYGITSMTIVTATYRVGDGDGERTVLVTVTVNVSVVVRRSSVHDICNVYVVLSRLPAVFSTRLPR